MRVGPIRMGRTSPRRVPTHLARRNPTTQKGGHSQGSAAAPIPPPPPLKAVQLRPSKMKQSSSPLLLVLAGVLSLSLLLGVAAAPSPPNNSHGQDKGLDNVHDVVQKVWSAIELWIYRLLHGGQNPPGYGASSSASSSSVRTYVLCLESLSSSASRPVAAVLTSPALCAPGLVDARLVLGHVVDRHLVRHLLHLVRRRPHHVQCRVVDRHRLVQRVVPRSRCESLPPACARPRPAFRADHLDLDPPAPVLDLRLVVVDRQRRPLGLRLAARRVRLRRTGAVVLRAVVLDHVRRQVLLH